MNPKRLLNIQHGYNYRDIGGYPTPDGRITKWHKIVRSGNLAQLSIKDQAYLLNYGVICDVDLRSKGEARHEPDRVPQGIKYIFNPIHGNHRPPRISDIRQKFSDDPTLSHRHMEATYRGMIEGHHARRYYRKLLKIFLKYGRRGAVLMHCSQGKDRTGMGIVMLLLTLGVDLPTVKKDYLISQQEMVPYVKLKQAHFRRYHVNANFMANIKSLYTVSGDYLDAAMHEIHRKYGTWSRFEKKYLHLNPRKIKRLKSYYLTTPNP